MPHSARPWLCGSGVAFDSLMPATLPFSANANAPKRRAAEKAAVLAAVEAAATAAIGTGRAIWILKDADLNQGQACTLLEDPAEIAAFLDAATAPLVAQVHMLPSLFILLESLRRRSRAAIIFLRSQKVLCLCVDATVKGFSLSASDASSTRPLTAMCWSQRYVDAPLLYTGGRKFGRRLRRCHSRHLAHHDKSRTALRQGLLVRPSNSAGTDSAPIG